MAVPDPTQTPTDEAWNPLDGIIDVGQDIADNISGTVGFWSDPFGSMYRAARDAVDGLTNDFLPAVTGATLPDLSNPAFLDTYRVSFTLSLFVAVVLLVVQLVRTAKGSQSGRDTLHAIGIYFPGFIFGVMFGPLIGILIVNFVHALSDSLLQWAYNGTADELAESLSRVMLEDPAQFAGGVAIAWMIGWAMVIGLLLVIILFVIQLVTLYFSGALIPLAAVWIIDPTRRATGFRAVGFWVGLLLTHPLLFLLLGLAFRIIGSTITTWGSDGWRNLITLLIAVMAMYAAAFSPFFLLKYVKSITEGAPGSGGGSSSPPIGQPAPSNVIQNSARTSSALSATPASSTTQTVRNGSAPAAGRSLGQAAAARSGAAPVVGGGGGRVVTAGAGGAARAGMATKAAAAPAVAAATKAAEKGYRGAKEAADTSVTPPQREAYGKDRL